MPDRGMALAVGRLFTWSTRSTSFGKIELDALCLLSRKIVTEVSRFCDGPRLQK